MKKLKILLIICFLFNYANNTFAQETHWLLTGNSIATTDFLGSTNSVDLKFKANNQLGGLISITSTVANTLYGYTAGNAITSGVNNTFMGFQGGLLNTTGSGNTSLGSSVFSTNTTGNYNNSLGWKALTKNTTGNNNNAFGTQALINNTSGNYNLALGANALLNNTTGDGNVAVGQGALNSNTTANYNTAIGYNTLYYNTTGPSNSAIGTMALYSNKAGSNATAIGNYAMLYSNSTTGTFTNYNVALGYEALRGSTTAANNTGNENTALGYQTLWSNTTGEYNTASGMQSLYSNTTGTNNTANGKFALYTNSIGADNCATGYQALYLNTSGGDNTANGMQALYWNDTGSANVALGNYTLYQNDTGVDNTATGVQALQSNTTGEMNTANGRYALQTNTTGSYNTAIGHQALYYNTTGTCNTVLGYMADANSGTYTNSTAIGSGALVEANNEVVIGISTISTIGGYQSWTNLGSDSIFKYNVNENVKGLEFIKKLRPVTYTLDTKKVDEFVMKNMPDSIRQKRMKDKDYTYSSGIVRNGFIGQEVARAAKEINYNFDGVIIPKNENEHYSIAYSQFVVPLVKAVQELQMINDSLKTNVIAQKNNNDSLINDVKLLKEKLSQLEALVNQCCNIKPEKKGMSYQETELKNGEAIVLDQNVPNPFAESTVISYFIPDNVGSAQIIFTDNLGKVIRTVDITSKGQGMLKVYAQDLSSGIYSYTLVADGKTIDSKKMVKIK